MFIKFNLQKSFDKVKFLTILQFVFIVIAFLSEAISTHSVLNFSFFIQVSLLLVLFNFYFKALLNLYYSFWNISAILLIYYLLSCSRNFLVLGNPIIGSLFLFSVIFLIVSIYIISSPLYYPRFSWWEYDFRYRTDIKCTVSVDAKEVHGRLSDLRRGAACLELFSHLSVGQIIQIHSDILSQTFTLVAEVRSKREPIIGRSFVYGIKFVNYDLEQKQRLKFLTHYWNETKKIKNRKKFSLGQS
jgi:hypothetical protein